jgi:hypothetical protein
MKRPLGGLFFNAERPYVWLDRQRSGQRRRTWVTPSQSVERPTRTSMPGRVRWAVIGAIGLVLAGTLYLLSVRGEALLLDLKALGGILCF